jgi:hypothetical protein
MIITLQEPRISLGIRISPNRAAAKENRPKMLAACKGNQNIKIIYAPSYHITVSMKVVNVKK